MALTAVYQLPARLPGWSLLSSRGTARRVLIGSWELSFDQEAAAAHVSTAGLGKGLSTSFLRAPAHSIPARSSLEDLRRGGTTFGSPSIRVDGRGPPLSDKTVLRYLYLKLSASNNRRQRRHGAAAIGCERQ